MKITNLPHLAARIFDTPLLIQRQKLDVILAALGPRIGLMTAEPIPMDDIDDMPDMDETYDVTSEGIAVIQIQGTLVKKSGWLDAASGMTSYEGIRQQCEDACADANVHGILLDIDSPGGEVGGLFDLADYIYSQRQTKPIYAIADDDAFSAAYALASAAEKVFVTRTGGVGSVGVIALHIDQSGWDQKLGLKYTYVSAGARKQDLNPHEPISDEAQATLQTEIDRLYGIFVQTVARNRGMKPNAVRSTEAGMLFAENAVTGGFADAVGTFSDAMAAVTEVAAKSASMEDNMPDDMDEIPGARKPMGRVKMRAKTSAGVEALATNAVPEAAATVAPILLKEANMAETTKAVAAPTVPDAQASAELKAVPANTSTETAKAAVPPTVPTEKPAELLGTLGVSAPFVDAGEIIALCKIAGQKALAVDFIEQKLTVAQVREKLLARRIEESGAEIQTQHSAGIGVAALTLLDAAAESVRHARPSLTKEQAATQAMREHPELYEQYLTEHPAQRVSLNQ